MATNIVTKPISPTAGYRARGSEDAPAPAPAPVQAPAPAPAPAVDFVEPTPQYADVGLANPVPQPRPNPSGGGAVPSGSLIPEGYLNEDERNSVTDLLTFINPETTTPPTITVPELVSAPPPPKPRASSGGLRTVAAGNMGGLINEANNPMAAFTAPGVQNGLIGNPFAPGPVTVRLPPGVTNQNPFVRNS